MEPEPRAEHIVPNLLLPQFGWPDKKWVNELSFRQTLNALQFTDRGFTITLDRSANKLMVSFDFDKVDTRHIDWVQSLQARGSLGPLQPQPYWDVQELSLKVSTKMLNAFFVEADASNIFGQPCFKIHSVLTLQGFSTDRFMQVQEILGIEMQVLDGGTQRTNLNFVVIRTATAQKLDHISRILEADLPTDQPGGAIIYCATRHHAEQVAGFLKAKDIAADHFHAGLTPERKKYVQQSFIQGGLRAIAATNAFGMGIDKPDVRLVIHADIPGSLENYLQEAGRAGRDSGDARCILLYTDEDIEQQFGMSARSRLTQAEINAVLKALRNLDRRERLDGEVVATAGEILLLD